MQFSLVLKVFMLVIGCFAAETVKKKFVDTINVCQRNDPELSKCLCTNINNVLPKLKNGVPEMNIVPSEPFPVEEVKIDFSKSQTVKLTASLQNVTLYGISKTRVENCGVYKTSNGVQFHVDFNIPEVVIKSLYKAVGNILLMKINGSGDYRAEFTGVNGQTVWNSTRYMNDGKEYLNYKSEFATISWEKVAVHFNNIFGNNTGLNEDINHTINENINALYNELKPILSQALGWVIQKIINDFHIAFPYDLLYPTE